MKCQRASSPRITSHTLRTPLPHETAGLGWLGQIRPFGTPALSNLANITGQSTANHRAYKSTCSPIRTSLYHQPLSRQYMQRTLCSQCISMGLGVHIKLQRRIELYSVSIAVPPPQRNVQSSERSTTHQGTAYPAICRYCQVVLVLSSPHPSYAPCSRQFLESLVVIFFPSCPSRSNPFALSIVFASSTRMQGLVNALGKIMPCPLSPESGFSGLDMNHPPLRTLCG